MFVSTNVALGKKKVDHAWSIWYQQEIKYINCNRVDKAWKSHSKTDLEDKLYVPTGIQNIIGRK